MGWVVIDSRWKKHLRDSRLGIIIVSAGVFVILGTNLAI